MMISKDQIENYIPQRWPFVMIDNLTNFTTDMFESDFCITDDNIFLENGILREYALIENIAQTSAVGIGLTKTTGIEKPVDGFIGGVSKLIVYGLPKVGDTIFTVVTLITQFENMFLLKGENYFNEQKLLECEIKLVGIGK